MSFYDTSGMSVLDVTDNTTIMGLTDTKLGITNDAAILPITNTEGGALDITNPEPEEEE